MVVGAGRLGSSLALALRRAGARLLGFTAGSAAGRARAEAWLGRRAAAELTELVSLSPRLYVVAVPDDRLPEVADRLGRELHHRPPGPAPLVCHTSGAASVSVLRPCEEAGAGVFAFHPLQTFPEPTGGSRRFAGIGIAVTPSESTRSEGNRDSRAVNFALQLASSLGARAFLLPDERRVLYHAAATLACNYLVTLEYQALQLFIKAGLPRDEALSLFLPLVETTLQNVAGQGPVAALTGPLSRGDKRTVVGHLSAMEIDAPHLVPLYGLLGLATLDLLRARGEVDERTIAELATLLEVADAPQPEFGRRGTS